ncbi:tyrosine-type recombinase/integrase [Streptomyces sp. NPDC056361]|uniref:tyrosine-type recombinase/integrase n=1 Tax=Streptomyces sp. NPDC056361 TaxID=3345795 RepID=UPI0035E25125
MADLFEVLIGTGMRRGEVLGLHWNDIHLDQGVLYVRCTLSSVDNNRLVIPPPARSAARMPSSASGTDREHPVGSLTLATGRRAPPRAHVETPARRERSRNGSAWTAVGIVENLAAAQAVL